MHKIFILDHVAPILQSQCKRYVCVVLCDDSIEIVVCVCGTVGVCVCVYDPKSI